MSRFFYVHTIGEPYEKQIMIELKGNATIGDMKKEIAKTLGKDNFRLNIFSKEMHIGDNVNIMALPEILYDGSIVEIELLEYRVVYEGATSIIGCSGGTIRDLQIQIQKQLEVPIEDQILGSSDGKIFGETDKLNSRFRYGFQFRLTRKPNVEIKIQKKIDKKRKIDSESKESDFKSDFELELEEFDLFPPVNVDKVKEPKMIIPQVVRTSSEDNPVIKRLRKTIDDLEKRIDKLEGGKMAIPCQGIIQTVCQTPNGKYQIVGFTNGEIKIYQNEKEIGVRCGGRMIGLYCLDDNKFISVESHRVNYWTIDKTQQLRKGIIFKDKINAQHVIINNTQKCLGLLNDMNEQYVFDIENGKILGHHGWHCKPDFNRKLKNHVMLCEKERIRFADVFGKIVHTVPVHDHTFDRYGSVSNIVMTDKYIVTTLNDKIRWELKYDSLTFEEYINFGTKYTCLVANNDCIITGDARGEITLFRYGTKKWCNDRAILVEKCHKPITMIILEGKSVIYKCNGKLHKYTIV
jgi:hypothetical protein